MSHAIHYRAGYRFQLAQDHPVQTGIAGHDLGNAWVELHADGTLTIRAGYAWDGASGPVRQSPDILRGSLVHDALYQLIRECGLPPAHRGQADDLLRAMCIADGMPAWHADLVHAAVSAFGAQYAQPGLDTRPVQTAPVPVTYLSTAELIAP